MEIRAVSGFIPSGDHEVVICEVVQFKNGVPTAADHPSKLIESSNLSTVGTEVDIVAAEALYTADLRREVMML